MNVLMLVSWYAKKDETSGGIFHYEQAADLNRFCNCALYYPYDRYITKNYEYGIERGILTFRSKYALQNKIRNRICMFQAMREIVRIFHPDIIHGNVATEGGRFAVIMGKLFHIPVIITEHSSVAASNVEHFPHYYYARFVYGNSRYNACVSDSLTKGLQKIFPQYAFHTIYNGIQELKPTENKRQYYKDGVVNIGMIAGFYSREIKGVQYVLPAVGKMLDNGYRIHLHMIGGGEYLQEYIDMAEEIGIAQSSTFYGDCKKDEVFAIDSEMDFIVSASLFESFGCAVAEAVMLGKPVVATKNGGAESIVNPENGILVETGSMQAIYNGMVQMYNKYREYDAEKISEQANQKFEISGISRKYMRIYHDILSRGKK